MGKVTTVSMAPQLKAILQEKGWNPDLVLWGRRVRGNVHGVTLERCGNVHTYNGPLTTVEAGGQSAIVRWG